jgi:aminopeptidase N
MSPLFLLTAVVAAGFTGLVSDENDGRRQYDVLTYRIDLRVDPNEREISGVAYTRARVVRGPLHVLQLDVGPELEVTAVREIAGELTERSSPLGRSARFDRADETLLVELSRARKEGEILCVAVEYHGRPTSVDNFFGFHWEETADGRPWISTSVQTIGARTWWPCKDSFFHPNDKPDEVFLNLTVPDGLQAVSNGRLRGRSRTLAGWETFHWVHPYPCETYSVTLNVAPYVVVERELKLFDVDGTVPFVYYVLPESVEKARLQFEDVPSILDVYGDYFGPWPFPESKIGIVQTGFLGMEHSTAIAYGSSFPAWKKAHDEPDPWAHRNRGYDYVLVHQLAHEWWGNAVSAKDWGHVWIHEGFATYAESLVTETWFGRERADEFFERTRTWIAEDSRLFRGTGVTSEQAISSVVYVKGAWLLHMLRHYLDDDPVWWRVLRQFQARYRYGNADTEDFRAVLEELTDRSWVTFFDEWFYGSGYPTLRGTVRPDERSIAIEIDNPVRHDTPFHVPLDLGWYENGAWLERRLPLQPGANSIRVRCEAPPTKVEVLGLQRVLGRHEVTVVLGD